MNQDRIPLTHEEEEKLLRKYMVERTEPVEGIFVSSNWLQQNDVIKEDNSDSWQIIREYEKQVFKRDKNKIVKEIMDEMQKRK